MLKDTSDHDGVVRGFCVVIFRRECAVRNAARDPLMRKTVKLSSPNRIGSASEATIHYLTRSQIQWCTKLAEMRRARYRTPNCHVSAPSMISLLLRDRQDNWLVICGRRGS